MRDTIYIVVAKTGFLRTHKSERFTLNPGERAFQLLIEIPDEAFTAPPMPTVRMTIPAEALTREITVTTESPDGNE